MKAAIKNPYLDTLGGGERYTVGVVKTLLDLGYKVDLEWEDPSIVAKLEERFGTKLDGLEIIKDINRGDGYDVCFWVSDGSIPTLRSRKNILHFQFPFHHIGGNNLLNKMKLFRVDHIICNSEFTKKIIDQEYGVESLVIYPPIDLDKIKHKRKENIILYVGRFSNLVQSKGQDILINAFKEFCTGEKFNDVKLDNWKLILAGGTEVGVSDGLKSLKDLSKGFPIEFIENPKYSELCNLYGRARFFWSASGFGADEENNPEKLEHFGITTVEAMAGGAVPIVYNGGGQREIVKNNVNGILWSNQSDLVGETKKLINDTKISFAMSKESRASAEKFSYERFKEKIISII